jgi:hypothetical protein
MDSLELQNNNEPMYAIIVLYSVKVCLFVVDILLQAALWSPTYTYTRPHARLLSSFVFTKREFGPWLLWRSHSASADPAILAGVL